MTVSFAIALLVATPVQFDVLIAGQKSGIGSIEQRLLEDGRKLNRVEMKFPDLGIDVAQESTYNPDGSPYRMLQTTVRNGKREVRHAVFDGKVVAYSGTDIETAGVPYPAGGVAAPSEFWFLRDLPIQGEKVLYYRFDLGTGAWKSATASYVGPRETVLGGKVWKVHRTIVDGVKSDLDERGDPVRIELQNGIVLERR
ncbi:MAG: hypothetical protein AB7F50_08325 [Fimbriimonadaceae bacterium]